MQEEIWKNINGYSNYMISNMGRVKRLGHMTKFGRAYKYLEEQIFYGHIDDVGYKYIILSNNGIQKRFRIHRLVAEAFIPNPENKPEIDHINTDRTDNTVWLNEDGSVDYEKTNLRWVTRKENLNNNLTKAKMKQLPKFKGKEHPRAKRILQFNLDGLFIKEYECIKDAVAETNGSKSSIIACCKGRHKVSGGYIWRYKEEKAA